MKRILILANNSGGLYRFRKELMCSLISKGYEVYASTPFDDNVEDLKKMNVHLIETKINRRGMNPIKDSKLLLNYFSLIRKVKPEMIITYTIKPNLYGGLVARLLKVPYALNITGLGTAFQNEGLLKTLVSNWYKVVCQRVNVIFFENEGNMDTFINNKIVRKEKCYLLHGAGVNLEDFPTSDYPVDDKQIQFLFIGRIMKEKGIEELFDAFERLKKEFNHIELDVIGELEDDYKEKIEVLMNRKIINYYGYQEDVKPFIKQCHCFVLPSYHEGMANTLLESAAMGRPLITSNIHGCKEAINNNGYLCQPQDSEDLYQQIKKFINLSYQDKQQLALNSRKHMEEVFDKKKVVEETMKGLGLC